VRNKAEKIREKLVKKPEKSWRKISEKVGKKPVKGQLEVS